jgi:hypothetical protein
MTTYYKSIGVSKNLVIEPPTTRRQASDRLAQYARMLEAHHICKNYREAVLRALDELKTDARIWNGGGE